MQGALGIDKSIAKQSTDVDNYGSRLVVLPQARLAIVGHAALDLCVRERHVVARGHGGSCFAGMHALKGDGLD